MKFPFAEYTIAHVATCTEGGTLAKDENFLDERRPNHTNLTIYIYVHSIQGSVCAQRNDGFFVWTKRARGIYNSFIVSIILLYSFTDEDLTMLPIYFK